MPLEPSSETTSLPLGIVYVFQTRVKKLEKAKISLNCEGWFVHLEGSWESLFLGEDEPNLVVGDTIEVRIRRI